MANLKTILLGIALLGQLALQAQGYITDKENKCKMYTLGNPKTLTYTYTGTCADGYLSGKASVLVYLEGSLFTTTIGNFSRGVLNGQAKITWFDGDVFEGECEDGYRKYGTLKVPGGNTYTGPFNQEGRYHGKGTSLFPDGKKYEGDFVEHVMQGKGILYYPSGNRYEGHFANDVRGGGSGIFYFKNGDRYEGEWGNDYGDDGFLIDAKGSKKKGRMQGENFILQTQTITFDNFTKAYQYLNTDFSFTPKKVENGYWIDPYVLSFDNGKYLLIGECKGKALEKDFLSYNYEVTDKAITLLEDEGSAIEWSKISDIVVSYDKNTESYFVTIYAPVYDGDLNIKGGEMKLYVQPDQQDNVKNALLRLAKEYVELAKKDVEKDEKLKENEKQLKKQEAELKKLHEEATKKRAELLPWCKSYFSSRESARAYLKNNLAIADEGFSMVYQGDRFQYWAGKQLVNTHFYNDCSYAEYENAEGGWKLWVYGKRSPDEYHPNFSCMLPSGVDKNKIKAAFNYLILIKE